MRGRLLRGEMDTRDVEELGRFFEEGGIEVDAMPAPLLLLLGDDGGERFEVAVIEREENQIFIEAEVALTGARTGYQPLANGLDQRARTLGQPRNVGMLAF